MGLSGLGVAGVDLAGSRRRVTGLCYMDPSMRCLTARAYLDEEILAFIQRLNPGLVAIDAPLSAPPPGRSLRRCDEELKRMGLRPLPPMLGPMKMLTARAIGLREILESLGYKVVEVFPTGARRLLALPSKGEGVQRLRQGLTALGVKGLPEGVDEHVLDAVICAYVGLLYLMGGCVELGDAAGGIIVMPRPRGCTSAE